MLALGVMNMSVEIFTEAFNRVDNKFLSKNKQRMAEETGKISH
jgi:hypothetical protein